MSEYGGPPSQPPPPPPPGGGGFPPSEPPGGGYGPPPGGGYPPPGPPGGGYPPGAPPPPNYLVWAILTTLCCCLPLGVVSIVFAAQVNSKWVAGDRAGAVDSSKKAKTFAIWSAVIGVLLNGIGAIFWIAAVASQN